MTQPSKKWWKKKALIHNEIIDGEMQVVCTFPFEWDGTMEELGKRDIPKGCKFKVVEPDDIPSDRTFELAWEIDDDLLTDGVGEQAPGIIVEEVEE